MHIAEEAARLIVVEYELLPPLLDGKAAMQADVPTARRPAHRRVGSAAMC